ncbi:orotidine-5'-phosphate decarboxylase [Candidatus Aerophobetes bacterium]|nr:orotidine-5'-phosphate decarboxylase [Candidatus Aerophobetes bacterium]
MQNIQRKDRLILALDVDTEDEAKKLVLDLREWVSFFKVGMRLFFRYGPQIVNSVQRAGGAIFLDAKLHDIPSVVEAAVRVIGRMGVSMVTIHTLGGKDMMRRAKEAAKEESPRMKVLGVTLLTSMDDRILREELGVKESVQEKVLFLALRAQEAGLDGVVCSGREVRILRESLGPDFILVVPGIRKEKIEGDEQKRVLTPTEAIKQGADYLVIGRPILQASNPATVAKEMASGFDI